MATNTNQNVTYTNYSDIQPKVKTVTSTTDVSAIKSLSTQFRQYVATKHII